MKNYLFALSLGFVGVIWATQHAEAQPSNCALRASVVERLQETYGETRQSVGLGQNYALVEVFASNKTGTWMMLISLPNGTTCLVTSRESWEQMTSHRLTLGNNA